MSLSDPQLTELRALLENQIRELTSALAGTNEAAKPVQLDQPAVGRVSRIDAIQQQKMLEANRAASKSRLTLSKAAMTRLEDGDFGECAACGEFIAIARLRARPESIYCIECQRARERS